MKQFILRFHQLFPPHCPLPQLLPARDLLRRLLHQVLAHEIVDNLKEEEVHVIQQGIVQAVIMASTFWNKLELVSPGSIVSVVL